MYDRVAANRRKTWGLLFGFTALVLAVGWAFGYLTGLGWWALAGAVVLTVLLAGTSYWNSDRIALAFSGAKPADPDEYQTLHNVVEEMAIASGVPKPRVHVVDDPAPNAFATGRDPEHAAIAVTTGLLERMDRDELQAVIAHELSHVKNRDTLVMTVAVVLVGVVVLLADWLIRAMWFGGLRGGGGRGQGRRGGGNAGAVLVVLALALLVLSPLIAQALKFAISRRREYLADADAVLLTRHPQGMISALEKLRDDTTVVRSASRAMAHLWIEEPIPRRAHEGDTATPRSGAWLNRLFQTHPPIEDRIAALREGSLNPYAGRE